MHRLHSRVDLLTVVVVVVAGGGGDGEESRLVPSWPITATWMARSELLRRPQLSSVLPLTKRVCLR